MLYALSAKLAVLGLEKPCSRLTYIQFCIVEAHLSTVAEISRSLGFSKMLAPRTLQTVTHMLCCVLLCFQVL